MSSMTLIFVAPRVSLHNKAQPYSITTFRLLLNQKQGNVSLGRRGESSDGRQQRIVTNAGLGRVSSGAVHGCRSKKGRRRKPSQVDDGDDANSSSNESDTEKFVEKGPVVRTSYGDVVDDAYNDSSQADYVDLFHDDGIAPRCNIDGSIVQRASELQKPDWKGNSVAAGEGLGELSFAEDQVKVWENERLGRLSSQENTMSDNDNGSVHSDSSKEIADVCLGTNTQGESHSDAPKKGSTKPAQMQRRNSRGRKRKQPLSPDDESLIVYPEEVAPVAATILTDPNIFESEQSQQSEESKESTPYIESGHGLITQDAGWAHLSSKYDLQLQHEKQKELEVAGVGVGQEGDGRKEKLKRNPKGLESMTDKAHVRVTTGEAERPAELQGSLSSIHVQSVEGTLEEVATNMKALQCDINCSNGHIHLRLSPREKENHDTSKVESIATDEDLLQLVRPKILDEGPRPAHPKSAEKETSWHLSEVSALTPDVRSSVTDCSAPGADVIGSPAASAVVTANTHASLAPTVQFSVPPPLKLVKDLPAKVAEIPTKVVVEASQLIRSQVVEPVVEALPDVVIEQVGQVVEQVVDLRTHVSEHMLYVAGQVAQIGQNLVDQASDALPDSVVEQAGQVAESVSRTTDKLINLQEQMSSHVDAKVLQVAEKVSATAAQVSESVTSTAAQVTESVTSSAVQVSESVSSTAAQVSSTAAQVSSSIVDFLTPDEDSDTDSDDEFEAFKTSDAPEFRGMKGLENFDILQEEEGILTTLYDFYIFMLKKPLPQFASGMFAAPILLSVVFTVFYLPDFQGLALDETARNFNSAAGEDATRMGLELTVMNLFQVFMFSLSLSTGLQPELAPLSPYTLVVANINALFAQLIFVFLSGAVFARLSQPSQPVRCSTVALVCSSLAQRRRRADTSPTKVLMARYVLAGPKPCELVDVKVDLTYKYNTMTRSGTYFRATQSLKLVRPEIAYLNHGMLIRHIIDDTSPLYRRSPEMLRKEDAIFTLSVVGLERSSMQSVFHVQHYCVCDDHIIWDAEFEDMILISKKNKRIVDHSKLSSWRPV